MTNFIVRVCISPRPWPFRWGPFGKNATRDFLIDEGKILILEDLESRGFACEIMTEGNGIKLSW